MNLIMQRVFFKKIRDDMLVLEEAKKMKVSLNQILKFFKEGEIKIKCPK